MLRLKDAGVDSPRRDCLVFIEDVLEKDRSWVLAHHDHQLNKEQVFQLQALLERRIGREPLAYIRKKAWFYGRFFDVNPNVLIPRPETEAFVDIIKEVNPKQLFDIGTGSGCIAITTKLELPSTDVIATDIEASALTIAKQNAKKHNVTLGFIQANLLESFRAFDFSGTTISANLPYVPESVQASPEIESEPASALYSGESGLDHYINFWQQVNSLKIKPSFVLTESLEKQHRDIEQFANNSGYALSDTKILVQLFRLD